MTNKEKLEEAIKREHEGMIMGGCNDKIELLNKTNIDKVIKGLSYGGSTDVDVYINRKPHVVEISHVDNEIDFGVITKEEYINRYGDERYED